MKSNWVRPPLSDMICPVTGKQYVMRPEWVGSSDHHTYRLGVMDNEVILCQSLGNFYLEDVHNYCRQVDSILEEFHRPGRKMVLIEDYTQLGVTDNISRQAYISHHLKLQDDLHGVLFFGLNPFLKLIVRLSRRVLPLRRVTDSFPDYATALETAFHLLGRKLEVAAPTPGVETLVHGNARVESKPVDADRGARIQVEGGIRGSDIAPLDTPSLWRRIQRFFGRDQWDSAWKLMEFIGGIQWDSDAKGVNPYPVTHPFHQVATSLLVVKSDFDSLIAERLRREKELEDARERAEEANRLQARFLANVSHEIRTPLNAVLGMGEMLSDTHMDPVQQDLLRTMRQSSQGLLTVINDILDLSRMEAGEFRLSQDVFDLAAVLDEVGRMMGYLAISKGLEWRVQKSGTLPIALRGDPVRLRQVLLNLAGNAVKFTERGHVFMDVRRLRNTHGSAILQFRVEDTGPGIPPDRMGEIFQPFRQLDGSLSRRHGGTGLGLAIAHNLVRQMGGNLGVESSPVGSVFGFRLSLPEADHHLLRTDFSSGAEGPLVGRVLVAEDNRVNQKVVVGLLAKLGLESDVVENGRLTLEALKNHAQKYQLVLMDIQMPEMDGIEAVLRIRSGEAGESSRRIPVVALTAHAMEGDRELFLKQGMDDYISKPIRLADLRGVMERWLGELHSEAS